MANNKVSNNANLVQSEPKFKEMGIQCNLMDCQCRWEDETVPAASDDEGPEDFEDAKATTSSNITIPSQTPVKPPTMSTALVPVNISPQKRARDKLRKDRADRRLAPASSVDLASIEKVHQTELVDLNIGNSFIRLILEVGGIQTDITRFTNFFNNNSLSILKEFILNLLHNPKFDIETVKKKVFKTPQTFGSTIPKICEREKREVPNVLEKLTRLIEGDSKYIKCDGLYRINANTSTLQTHKFEIEDENYTNIEKVTNAHTWTGLVKLFLRELKEPLIPYDIMKDLIQIMEKNPNVTYKSIPDIIWAQFDQVLKKMTKNNKTALDFLTKHWGIVLKNASNNETPDKLAIAIGPSITRIDETDLEAAQKVFTQNKVLGILISRSMEQQSEVPTRRPSRVLSEPFTAKKM